MDALALPLGEAGPARDPAAPADPRSPGGPANLARFPPGTRDPTGGGTGLGMRPGRIPPLPVGRVGHRAASLSSSDWADSDTFTASNIRRWTPSTGPIRTSRPATPANSLRVPAPIAAMSRDLAIASPATPQITPRVLMRGLSRHWWRIMLFWLVVSTPLAYLIYALVEPTFEATSLLVAEPTTTKLYGRLLRGTPNMPDVKPYLLTQVQLITSNSVLDAAISADPADRQPADDPLVQGPEGRAARGDARRDRRGEHLPDPGRPGLEGPEEAAAIVNAVVDAYIEQHNRYHLTANRSLKMNLESELDKLAKKIKAKHRRS